jgi:hypothetical protein
MKKSNYLIGNRTRDLPACSIVPVVRVQSDRDLQQHAQLYSASAEMGGGRLILFITLGGRDIIKFENPCSTRMSAYIRGFVSVIAFIKCLQIRDYK